MRITTIAKLTLPFAGALTLAACGGEAPPEEETGDQTPATYSTDVEDLGGGEIIATDQQADAVPVELPETEMTPVPPAEEAPAE